MDYPVISRYKKWNFSNTYWREEKMGVRLQMADQENVLGI